MHDYLADFILASVLVMIVLWMCGLWLSCTEELESDRSRFERFLRKYVPHKEIGWKEIGEEFTRYQLLKTRWFNIYLHQLLAPNSHEYCHDHPWNFVSLILSRGYAEYIDGKYHARYVGTILYRSATDSHIVVTPNGTCWSLVITGPKIREWGYNNCEE